MRIPSGKTDQNIYFVAYDSADHTTRKTGLSSFTVYRSRNNGTATIYTTPTVSELSSANMPGVYALTVDEDTTIASGSDSEEYCVHITCSGMDPVTRSIELYRRDTTSGRTLDVSSGGEAGLDWANIGSPTTTVGLSGTTVKTATDVETDTADIQSRLPAALVSGRIDASVGAMASAVLTDTAIAADAITDAKVASDVTIASVTGAVGSVTGSVGSVVGDIGGNLTGSIGSLSTQAKADVNAEADTALADAGVTTIVTGRIDAAISTRLSSASYTAPDNTSITAIKAKTDNLPTDPADESLIIAATDAIVALIGTPVATVSGDIAAVKAVDDAIKAKTDSLTYTVAGQVDSNIQSVNDVTVTGTGASGNEWGP